MRNKDFITVDYIRFVVELSGITEFLEFAKDDQYYYILNAAVDYGIVDELFPNSSVRYLKAIKVLKKYKSFKSFYKSRSYKEYQGLKNIDNLYHYIWSEEFEYIDNYISKEQLIRIMMKYKRWNYLKQHYNNIYHYIFDVLYPIPFDYNLPIQSVLAYIYMIENEMIEYPRSIVFKQYVKFNSNKIFCVFASNEEMNNTKEGIEYMNKLREIICLLKYGSKTYTGTDEFKKKTNETVKEKYGVYNISQLEEIKQKKIETTRKNFGVDYPLQSKEVRNRYIDGWKKTRGVTHISQDPEIKEKKKQTSFKHYGVENPSLSEEIKEKKKQTTFEHFGVFNPLQSDVVKEKSKQTCLERYGTENPHQNEEVKEKSKQTCLERFGTEYPLQNEEVKEKSKQTCLERFGTEYPLQNEEVKELFKQTCLERFGTENPSQNEEVKEKSKQTCLERYGTEYPLQNEEVKEKSKQTCIEKYGFEYSSLSPEIIQKINETKHLNNSFTKSEPEEKLYKMLISVCGEDDIIRQYNSERYPFSCDFYIKSLDVFIEYQGFWSHNVHPYNPDSEEDLKTLNIWKSKSEERKLYINAINVWTFRDPLKRKTAKENNLNYVELWNMNEAEAFIDDLKKQLNLERLDKKEEDNNINTLF